MLVRAINQKSLLGISPNLVCICILTRFQHLLNMRDLDLHLQGHLTLKYFKFDNFGGLLAWSITESFLPLGLSGRRGIVVACVRPSVYLSVCNTFDRAITFDRIGLGSPNLAQICTLAMPWMGLFMGMINLEGQGQSYP